MIIKEWSYGGLLLIGVWCFRCCIGCFMVVLPFPSIFFSAHILILYLFSICFCY
ncbi:uncharacterized protein P884DRAFT_258433 [Thermothelomyces heterothallicus CBS 202.75]|uniref:uncharacterized protein n=1 Tax=Thermothelomyces heterothallicus CBS 202.75 TaxID=1149848 RepID=UPI0037430C2C